MFRPRSLSFLAGVLGMAVAVAEARPADAAPTSPPDKSGYTLFHPTPRSWMREMSTDRPDRTESPFTVDAGHFQFEADILNYTYDRYNVGRSDTRVETVSIAPVNLKLGLLDRVDCQVILGDYVSERTHDVDSRQVRTRRGFGDVTARVKWNFWGNDGGATAMGLIPYVNVPTGPDEPRTLQGGIILPLAVELPAGWTLAAMSELDVMNNAGGRGRHFEFAQSASFGHDIVGRLAGYLEFFSAVSAESGSDWVGTVDLGLTWGLSADIQLDAGVNLGVTRAADDINPFVGISWRF